MVTQNSFDMMAKEFKLNLFNQFPICEENYFIASWFSSQEGFEVYSDFFHDYFDDGKTD